MMLEKYRQWIDERVPTYAAAYGKCKAVTDEMSAEFPELTRVRGHYHCDVWGERGHWWLVDASGDVVDPTSRQFPSRGQGPYTPWDDSQPEPTGRCLNCGEDVYDGSYCCGEECRLAVVRSCSG